MHASIGFRAGLSNRHKDGSPQSTILKRQGGHASEMLTTMMPNTPQRILPPDRRSKTGSFARAAGSFVPKLTAKVFEKYGFHSAEIMTSWARVAGADIAAISAPERLKWPRGAGHLDGDRGDQTQNSAAMLVLRVDPAHALDVEYRSGEIVDRINRYFGYRAVQGLKILQVPLQDSPASAFVPMTRVSAPPAPAELVAVPEQGLKDALTALWTSVTSQRSRR
jgi:hypothetical protein